MDNPTLDYFALHASEVAQRYEVTPSRLAHRFAELLSDKLLILEFDPKEHLLRIKNSQTLLGVESAALAPGYATKGGDLE